MSKPARFTRDVPMVFRRLEEFHGIPQSLSSQRLHQIKQHFGLSGDTDLVLDYTGNVYDPMNGECLGSLTEGGGRSRA